MNIDSGVGCCTELRGKQLLRIAAGLLLVCGCSKSEDAASAGVRTVSPAAQSSESKSAAGSLLQGKIEFKDVNGDTAFSLKPKEDGANLVDAHEAELARFVADASKLRVRNTTDQVLGYIIASNGKYKIENSTQDVELWKFQRQEDGDWKLEDSQERLIYKIKKRDYGFEIEDGLDNSLAKIRKKDGKTLMQNAFGKTVFSTRDQISTIAFACLAFDAIDSQPLRMALMIMVLRDNGG
jgi:hypothetical protein